jgi:hypothetical protein
LKITQRKHISYKKHFDSVLVLDKEVNKLKIMTTEVVAPVWHYSIILE